MERGDAGIEWTQDEYDSAPHAHEELNTKERHKE